MGRLRGREVLVQDVDDARLIEICLLRRRPCRVEYVRPLGPAEELLLVGPAGSYTAPFLGEQAAEKLYVSLLGSSSPKRRRRSRAGVLLTSETLVPRASVESLSVPSRARQQRMMSCVESLCLQSR